MGTRGLPGRGGKGLKSFEEALGGEGGRPRLPRREALEWGERIAIQRLDRDLQILAQLMARPADHVQAFACRGEMVGQLVLAVGAIVPGRQGVAGVDRFLVKRHEVAVALAEMRLDGSDRVVAAQEPLGRVMQQTKDKLNEMSEDQKATAEEQAWFRTTLPSIAVVDEINGLIERAKAGGTACKALLNKRAEELGFTHDKKAGAYVAPEQPKAPVEQAKAA